MGESYANVNAGAKKFEVVCKPPSQAIRQLLVRLRQIFVESLLVNTDVSSDDDEAAMLSYMQEKHGASFCSLLAPFLASFLAPL